MISVPGKLLCYFILKRIQNELEKHHRDEQYGFRLNRSCADLIFNLRVLTEESREWHSKLYIIFIDYEKAFDSVDRTSLWKILFYYRIPSKIIVIIIALYEDGKCCIKTSECQTRYFRILFGVKQGCVPSPLLFVIIINFILCNSATDGTEFSAELRVSDLDFANDITMLQFSKQRLQELLNRVSKKASQLGLRTNSSKINSMATIVSPLHISCGNEEIEQVMEFKYLGSIVKNMGSAFKEIMTRIGQENAAFNRSKRI